MIKKEVMIVLVTFCLTATLFSIIPVGSQGVREYDPWYDVTGPIPNQPDGKIDLRDYYAMGLKFGTAGDPTKNVNVTNWPDWIIDYDRTIDLKERIYPDTLTLIGGCCLNASGMANPILMMQSSLHPKLRWAGSDKYGTDQLSYMSVLNYRFVQIEVPQNAFNITGNVVSCMFVKYQASSAFPVWWKGIISFGIVRTDGSSHEIHSTNMPERYNDHLYGDGLEMTLIHSCPEPITVNIGERLYLQVGLEAKWDGEEPSSWIEFHVVVNTESDLLLQVPITPAT
jgi:hypothetical protein